MINCHVRAAAAQQSSGKERRDPPQAHGALPLMLRNPRTKIPSMHLGSQVLEKNHAVEAGDRVNPLAAIHLAPAKPVADTMTCLAPYWNHERGLVITGAATGGSTELGTSSGERHVRNGIRATEVA